MVDSQSKNQEVWVVIPAYNNAATVKSIALSCNYYVNQVLVIDDGSTDANLPVLFEDTDIKVLRHSVNLGKGQALRTALNYISESGGKYMITLDGDGQHYPEDLPSFLSRLDQNRILVGHRLTVEGKMPEGSRFGRRFSDFWVSLETGQMVADSQSGFRAYPVERIMQMPLRCRHYDFEIEVLARAAWAGLTLESIPIKVWYPTPGERVSNFRPFLDNLRISLTHTRLIGRRLLPWPTRRLVPRALSIHELIKHPVQNLNRLLGENASPGGLAAAASVGIFLGALPLIGFHMLSVIYVTFRLNLNKVMALAVQNICMPPLVPAICIAVGFYLRHGHAFTRYPILELARDPGQRFLEWFIGSLIVGPVLAFVVGVAVYLVAVIVKNTRSDQRITSNV